MYSVGSRTSGGCEDLTTHHTSDLLWVTTESIARLASVFEFATLWQACLQCQADAGCVRAERLQHVCDSERVGVINVYTSRKVGLVNVYSSGSEDVVSVYSPGV